MEQEKRPATPWTSFLVIVVGVLASTSALRNMWAAPSGGLWYLGQLVVGLAAVIFGVIWLRRSLNDGDEEL